MNHTFLIKKAILTEKTLKLAAAGKFTFQVAVASTKNQIRESIENIFGVSVTDVQTSSIARKSYKKGRRGQTAYTTAGKKAIVQLKTGQTIDLFDISARESK